MTPINQQNTAMISGPSSLKADTGSKVIIIGDEVTTLYSDEVERTGLMSEVEAKRLSRERKEKEDFLKRKAEHLEMSKAEASACQAGAEGIPTPRRTETEAGGVVCMCADSASGFCVGGDPRGGGGAGSVLTLPMRHPNLICSAVYSDPTP